MFTAKKQKNKKTGHEKVQPRLETAGHPICA